MEREADALAAYRKTRWTLRTAAGPLEVRVGQPVPPGSLSLPAAVITAYNPGSEPLSDRENQRASAALSAELTASGVEHREALAHGTGPEAHLWNEPGFLVTGLALSEVVALGQAFSQNAILWIGRDRVPVIVSTREGFAGSEAGSVL